MSTNLPSIPRPERHYASNGAEVYKNLFKDENTNIFHDINIFEIVSNSLLIDEKPCDVVTEKHKGSESDTENSEEIDLTIPPKFNDIYNHFHIVDDQDELPQISGLKRFLYKPSSKHTSTEKENDFIFDGLSSFINKEIDINKKAIEPLKSNQKETNKRTDRLMQEIKEEMYFNIGLRIDEKKDEYLINKFNFKSFCCLYPHSENKIETPDKIYQDNNSKSRNGNEIERKSFESVNRSRKTSGFVPVEKYNTMSRPLTSYKPMKLHFEIMSSSEKIISSSQAMEPSAPYKSVALKVLSPLNFTPKDIDEISIVTTQKYPVSSEICCDPKGNIIAASFSQLLIFLTDPENFDNDFQQQFLITSPSFITNEKFLGSLVMRFFTNIQFFDTNIKNDNELRNTQTKVVKILSKWIVITKFRFKEHIKEVIQLFKEKLESDPEHRSLVTIIENAILVATGVIGTRTLIFKYRPPSLVLPPNPAFWTITSVPAEEVARQLTLFHSEIFRNILPTEILSVVWGNKKVGGSPNLTKLIHHFNAFANTVILTVLLPEDFKQRGMIHAFWVEVAYYCLQFNNYHALFSICFGLGHPSIERLCKTAIFSARICGKRFNLEKIRYLCNFDSDYKNYREAIRVAPEPCVPFIGCIQKDLIYVQETFPNFSSDLVNFRKCKECVFLLEKMTRFQNDRYPFEVNEKVQQLITNIPLETDNASLMQLSISKEAKVIK